MNRAGGFLFKSRLRDTAQDPDQLQQANAGRMLTYSRVPIFAKTEISIPI